MTTIGVAVGLGNVWRFPYMVGQFGGASFVCLYLIVILLLGIPALMAEWSLGRHTRRGTLGAFERGGLPAGKYIGRFLVAIVFCATGYYANVLGWVACHAVGEAGVLLGADLNPAAVLPPDKGFNGTSFLAQMIATPLVLGACAAVLIKGLTNGIERLSKVIMPTFLAILLILMLRAITLDGAGEGLRWYIGTLRLENFTGSTMAAALGQAIFSMSLGGTFMVIYGSYMDRSENIPRMAVLTGIGDTAAGLLAGLAIFPAVFAFGGQPSSGPSLIFDTLPRTFDQMPLGGLFGFLFFAGLFSVAFLSAVAALEVLAGGLIDNTRMSRNKAVLLVCGIVLVLAIPPMINMKIFLPWDLTFGSGMQTLGAFLSVITTAWCIGRSAALKELATDTARPFHHLLYWWMRVVIPAAVLFVGVTWLLDASRV